jgi:hypothetical protein
MSYGLEGSQDINTKINNQMDYSLDKNKGSRRRDLLKKRAIITQEKPYEYWEEKRKSFSILHSPFSIV